MMDPDDFALELVPGGAVISRGLPEAAWPVRAPACRQAKPQTTVRVADPC